MAVDEPNAETQRPRKRADSPVSWIPKMANGEKGIMTTVVVSVVIAAILSASGTIVAVKVMSSDLERAKADIAANQTKVTEVDRELFAVRAAKRVSDERDSTRWADIKGELSKIREQQDEILRRLPRGR